MSDGVAVALITVVVGGLFTLLLRWVDRKADRAKEAVAQNTADVTNLNTALQGMKLLLDSQQATFDRTHRLDQERIQELEKDLIEEKSITVALDRELKKYKGKGKDEADPEG